jgi:hypothetical protein
MNHSQPAHVDTTSPMLEGGRLAGYAGLAVGSLRAHLLLLLLPITFLALSNTLTAGLVEAQRAPFLTLVKSLLFISLPTALVAMFFVRLAQYALVIKPHSALRQVRADIGYLVANPQLWINALPVVLAMIIHNKAALELKAAIPALNPFSWDQTFIELDRLLHFGTDPWRLLQPLLGLPWITFAINIAYNFWFVLMFGLWFWFAFQDRHSALRDRFFFAYSLTWLVGGGIMALAFSSAGPVYLANLGFTENPYTELMAYLHKVNAEVVPIWALDAQQMLWDGYTKPDVSFIGISAFPSMHNAIVTVFACAAWGINRTFGKAVTIYAGIILLGSVHLGWHYAVDGYAGIVLGLASWKIAGLVARWHERQPWVEAYRVRLHG